ncbi:MAG: quinolinate synthase NadA [Planctomycetes bacterium]|nr:quinolinate synthase NadA [Planctomycetota bacterium]MCB9870189.1 quinolinate synthase NadA [Planctomycetota bacterium]MCB9888231.1 quinolinate synthase NadA [Planctomycetota bacterium]
MSTVIDPALDLFAEIEKLKKKRRAIILAHYYQDPDIQDLADRLGDSLDLAKAARDASDVDVILFCGVHFMAETAKLLNPGKTVLLPDLDAGCSLADSCSGEQLREFRRKNPDHYVVTYINCSAAAKAQSDIICTSSNAEAIIRSVPADRPILFAPDRNLGAWLIKQTGREMTLWPGTCQVHVTFSERKILDLKARHRTAKFIAHPECEPNILRHADFVGSTRKLLQFVAESPHHEIIVGTETGILHTMRKAAPDKTLIEVPVESNRGCEGCNQCPYMKLNTIEKIYLALRDLQPRIEMDETSRVAAAQPLLRMLEIS